MNIDSSNAHCGPWILFLDHAWLRVDSISTTARVGDIAAALDVFRALAPRSDRRGNAGGSPSPACFQVGQRRLLKLHVRSARVCCCTLISRRAPPRERRESAPEEASSAPALCGQVGRPSPPPARDLTRRARPRRVVAVEGSRRRLYGRATQRRERHRASRPRRHTPRPRQRAPPSSRGASSARPDRGELCLCHQRVATVRGRRQDRAKARSQTSDQARSPAEFKHITKRRKRN